MAVPIGVLSGHLHGRVRRHAARRADAFSLPTH
jgi:hypothetical protein